MHHFGNEDVNRLHFVPKLCNRSGIDHRIRRFLVFFLRERTKPENFSDQTNKNNKLTLFSGQKQSLKGPYLLQYPYIRMHSLSSLAVYKKGAGTTIMLWGMGPGGWARGDGPGGMGFSAPLKQSLIPRRVISSWSLGGRLEGPQGAPNFYHGVLTNSMGAHKLHKRMSAQTKIHENVYFCGF